MIEKPECESFKQACGAEPQRVAEKKALREHMESCAPCLSFYEYMLSLDNKLMSAFALPIKDEAITQQVNVAHNSTSNVTSIHETKTKISRSRPRAWYAVAASVVAAVMVVFAVQYPASTIANDVVEHIHHEPKNLTLSSAISSEQQIESVLSEFNVQLSDSNVEVLSAKKCPVGSELAAHLVVRGDSGPVTILIFQNKKMRSEKIKTKEFNGRILPADYGTVAVVGGKKESLEQLEKIALSAFQAQG